MCSQFMFGLLLFSFIAICSFKLESESAILLFFMHGCECVHWLRLYLTESRAVDNK